MQHPITLKKGYARIFLIGASADHVDTGVKKGRQMYNTIHASGPTSAR